MGREARWDKDAMTVEIVFALVTGCVLAGAVFGVVAGLTLLCGVSGEGRGSLLAGGGLAGGALGVWRVVRVLRRFDAGRREGN